MVVFAFEESLEKGSHFKRLSVDCSFSDYRILTSQQARLVSYTYAVFSFNLYLVRFIEVARAGRAGD